MSKARRYADKAREVYSLRPKDFQIFAADRSTITFSVTETGSPKIVVTGYIVGGIDKATVHAEFDTDDAAKLFDWLKETFSDQEDEQRIQGNVRVRKEPEQTESEQKASREASETSGDRFF